MTEPAGNRAERTARTERHIRRVEAQLHALRTMESHLDTRELIWSLLAIPAVAFLCLIVAIKLRTLTGSLTFALLGALVCAGIVWWISRKWLNLAFLIVFGLFLVAFQTGDFPDLSSSDRKARRRAKLSHAIARREELLRTLRMQRHDP